MRPGRRRGESDGAAGPVDPATNPIPSTAPRGRTPAHPEDEGCFTSARARQGRVLHLERHLDRLARDAGLLGLGTVDRERAAALLRHGAEALGAREGIVRLEARPGAPGGPATLRVQTRPLDPDPRTWTGVTAPFAHPGPAPAGAAKRIGRAVYQRAEAAARRAGADEAILLDDAGRLVEGARTNVFVRTEGDRIVTPPLASGAVAGLARALVLERMPGVVEAPVEPDALACAREIVCTNAVRGARSLVRLDGKPVGSGRPGAVAAQLARLLGID